MDTVDTNHVPHETESAEPASASAEAAAPRRRKVPPLVVELVGVGREFKLRGPAGRIKVVNLRHLQPEEEAAAEWLPTGRRGRIVVAHPHGSPLIPALLAALNPGAYIEAYNFDLHDAEVLSHKLAPYNNITSQAVADLPAAPEEVQQGAVVVVRHGDSRDILFDTLERLALVLPQGSPVLLCLPKNRAQDSYKAITGCLTVRRSAHARGLNLIEGVIRPQAKPWTSREARFEVTTPTARIQCITRPGVFAHGRADDGGLALAECTEVKAADRVLDLGCGAGIVGLLLADLMRQQTPAPSGQVLLVDSNARAIGCAVRNIELNGFGYVSTQLAAAWEPDAPTFDVVAGNPPYYNDHNICRYFVEIAADALKPGGRLYLVSKHAEIVAGFVAARGLTLVEERRRRGYDITVAAK